MKSSPHFMVFSNLNIAAFDSNGEQIPELQESVFEILRVRMESLGYCPNGAVVEVQNGGTWRIQKDPGDEAYHTVRI